MINTKVNYFLCTFFICIGLQSHISFSQNYSDSAQYVKFNSIASRFARQGNTDSALYYRKTAKGFAKQPLQEAKVNLAIAWDYFDKRQFDSASFQVAYNFEKPLSFFSSHELIRELALSYHFIKNIYNYRGDYDNAEISLLKVIDLIEKESIDESVLIATYMDLGSNYFRISDYDKAMTWGKKSLIAAQNSPLPQAKTLEIRSYLLLGEIHWKKNELEKSSDHFKYVLSSISNMPDADERDYLLACMSLGGVFFDNAVYDSAYKYFGKAVNQLKVLEQSNYYKSLVPYYNINVLNSIAAIYNQREEYYKVNEVLKESIAIANTYYGKENAETAVLLSSLANNQINLGNYENAKSLLQKVIQIRRSAFGEKNSELSAAFNLMGQLHWKRDLPTLAAVYFDSALMSNKKITFLDQEIYSSGRCWQSYSGILKILLSGETLNRKNQIDSIHLLLQKQLRYGHGNSDSKLIESDIIEAQELLYNFYTEEYLKTSDHATATKLWEIAESGKARKLSSKINSDSRKYELIPQKLLARETKLRKEIENYLSSVDDQKIKTDSLLFLANRQYDEFMDSIELNYPKYFALKYPGLEIEENPFLSFDIRQNLCNF
ncbi:MAG: tetratricopeptide repeat protein, partial [Bacteroidota bacterium]